RRQYQKLADRLGVTGHVRFLGHEEDISKLYAQADVLVSSSRCEGLPFCVMEALYFGLPVIASDIKGHRDLIEHAYNGLLYDLKSDYDLAKHMIALGAFGEERSYLSANSVLPGEYLIGAVIEEYRRITRLPGVTL
ncbi:MAG: glycosyltransferase, partial [Oscillospiraceae bacterium]|nr:glycosyltransferase [Oscillospiraceae bacterium]